MGTEADYYQRYGTVVVKNPGLCIIQVNELAWRDFRLWGKFYVKLPLTKGKWYVLDERGAQLKRVRFAKEHNFLDRLLENL